MSDCDVLSFNTLRTRLIFNRNLLDKPVFKVTKRLSEVKDLVEKGYSILMVDGSISGWIPRKGIDFHFDHHNIGNAFIQMDEIPKGVCKDIPNLAIVTPQVDADACVSAAFALVDFVILPETKAKLRAISFYCDFFSVPPPLSYLADFASLSVSFLHSGGDIIIHQLGLPLDRKSWSIEQKELFLSSAFEAKTTHIFNSMISHSSWYPPVDD